MAIDVALVAGASDHASGAEENEDRILELPDQGIFAIADGAGGAEGAERAIGTLRRSAPSLAEFVGKVADDPSSSARLSVGRFFERIFQRAGDGVHDHARRTRAPGLSSTLLATAFADRYAFVAHVGHTRAYLLREGELWPLTTDHTVAARKLERKRITPEEYAQSPDRFELTQALGLTPRLHVSFAEVLLRPGDVLLLCSIGLPRHVEEATMIRVLGTEHVDTAVPALVAMARQAGGSDDISAIGISLAPDDDGEPDVDVAAIIRDVFLFERMSEADRARMAPYLDEARYAAGDVICREGDRGDEFYVVISGEVAVERDGTHLVSLGAGKHFGEISLVHGGLRTADVVAMESTVAYSLSRERFDELILSEPALGVQLLRPLVEQLAGRVADLTGRLVQAKAYQR